MSYRFCCANATRNVFVALLLWSQACAGTQADKDTADSISAQEDTPAQVTNGVTTANVEEATRNIAELSIRPSNKTCLAPTAKADGSTAFPLKLADTGCFSSIDLRTPAPGVIAYEVASPLWSDGASKRRWLAIPDNAMMTRSGPDDITMPPGSVLLKEFSLDGRVLETRILARRLDGVWGAGTYRWNAQQTDAELVVGDWQTETLKQTTWTYFGPAGCMLCHVSNKGTDLGIRDGQLNKDLTADAKGVATNQEAAFERLGLLQKAATPLLAAGTLVSADSSASLNKRARSYLDVNCASCHTKGARFFMGFDLSAAAPFMATGLCNVAPAHGDLGVSDARFVVPGEPAKSILSLRMHALNRDRMPKFGSSKVDEAAVAVIDAWITALKGCSEPAD